MVGGGQSALEWGIHLETGPSKPSERTLVVGCLRLLGLRHHMVEPVASGGVGSPPYSISID